MDQAGVRALRRNLRVIEREVERQLKAQTSCCGVTPAQCHALLELADLGRTSLTRLAERMKLDASTLSRTVDSLVRAGHVSRTADPASRRSVQLAVTPGGRRKVALIDRTCDRFYLDALRGIPKSSQAELAESVALISELFSRMGDCGLSGQAPCRGNGGRKNAGMR